MTGCRPWLAQQVPIVIGLALFSWAAHPADLADPGFLPETGFSSPRYFPRGDGGEPDTIFVPSHRRQVIGCVLRRAIVPTNAPDDPSYVGSEYGLGKPSYYGFTPPRGIDDPYGRPILPYCR